MGLPGLRTDRARPKPATALPYLRRRQEPVHSAGTAPRQLTQPRQTAGPDSRRHRPWTRRRTAPSPAHGVDHFTAVINPPQAAILAVGAAQPQPVVRDGELAVGTTMALTLSIDHRVLDGATAAVLLADLKNLLEHPPSIVL